MVVCVESDGNICLNAIGRTICCTLLGKCFYWADIPVYSCGDGTQQTGPWGHSNVVGISFVLIIILLSS